MTVLHPLRTLALISTGTKVKLIINEFYNKRKMAVRKITITVNPENR